MITPGSIAVQVSRWRSIAANIASGSAFSNVANLPPVRNVAFTHSSPPVWNIGIQPIIPS